jgi:glycosyltransferase involved in cell wall biosynthesis
MVSAVPYARQARDSIRRVPLQICLVEPNPSGGLFQFAFQFGEALARLGHEVELITGPDPELRPRSPGLSVSAILPTWHPGARTVERPLLRRTRRVVRGLRYFAAWGRVLLHLRRRAPDVVQWAEWRFAMDGIFVAAVGRRRPRPILADVAHTPVPHAVRRSAASFKRRGPLLSRALHLGYRSVDVVFVLGEASRRELLAAWPGVRRVEVIPHGDEGIFAAQPGPGPEACPPRAMFFGTWMRYKGLDLLLDAFARVRAHVPEAELVIAGSVGADIDFGELDRRAAAVGGIDLRPGYVPVSDVGELMASARIVVAPYRRANQSGVVHLAQTFGRPVVATDVGDLPSVIEDGVTGLVVPGGDVERFAEAMQRLLLDPAAAGRLGSNARERIREHGSWDEVARRVSGVYAELIVARAGEAGARPR